MSWMFRDVECAVKVILVTFFAARHLKSLVMNLSKNTSDFKNFISKDDKMKIK